ncbi:hypothetical protein BB561_004577 [Smittium simulii]|uniref:Nop domain-containing protein n=1 Tax=Smittium simulii TaxID=133385 RepID=A0A2T9YFF9_9FUNG|nr:hypothetical protein BB561_004577 [Smittium simulii]
MSLQDDLLADLIDSESEHEFEESSSKLLNSNYDDLNSLDDLQSSEDLTQETTSSSINSQVKTLAKVWSSAEYGNIISKIDEYSKQPLREKKIYGSIEEEPEYILVVKSNELSIKIDGEIIYIFKFIAERYSKRFPELESLISNPVSYAQTVKAIGDSIDISKAELDHILQPATKMVIAVTGSSTTGKPLPKQELGQVIEACDILIELYEAKAKIVAYVESRMSIIAPNLSAIVGTSTAAKLIIEAEGLTSLAKIPSCNLQVLGKNKQTALGLSSIASKKHVGFIYDSDYVQKVPSDFRSKMVRMVSAKSALAIRLDLLRESTDGSTGQKLKDDLDIRVEKLLEPSAIRAIKPLPVPFEGPKPRRAGKRLRRQKESTAITELRKSKNRVMFGVEQQEVVVMDEMESLGMLGQASGKVRAISANDRKVGLSKKYQKLLHLNSKAATSGLATSLSFTPVQGIELSNPKALLERQNKLNEANSRYFSGGFASAIPKK